MKQLIRRCKGWPNGPHGENKENTMHRFDINGVWVYASKESMINLMKCNGILEFGITDSLCTECYEAEKISMGCTC